MDTTRRNLTELEALSRKTQAAEKRILEAAQDRLAHVEERIAATRHDTLTKPGVAAEYQELILERGKLNQVIAQARKMLG